MRILLDTQALILAGQDNLSEKATEVFCSNENEIYFSLVSLWEIGIKSSIGKLKFKRKLNDYYQILVEEQGLLPLSIEVEHIQKATSLPFHHRDPFDRLLIGQSLVEKLVILSSDQHFKSYGCKTIWD